MRTPSLNLASRPFLNARPVARAVVLLWVLGGALAVFNAYLYWDFVTGTEGRAADLGLVEATIDEHEREVADLRRRLEAFSLPRQNAKVRFLNQRIRERTFAWSVLFDRLAEVMPGEVRLESLKPEAVEDHDHGKVNLKLSCQARNVEAELELVDRLFAHPAFERPDLNWDRVEQGGLVSFNLVVGYLPGDLPATGEESQGDAASAQQAATRLPRGASGQPGLEEIPDPSQVAGIRPGTPGSGTPGRVAPGSVMAGAAAEPVSAGSAAAAPGRPEPAPAASDPAGGRPAAAQRPDPASGDSAIQAIRERLRQGTSGSQQESQDAAQGAVQGGVPGFVVPRAPVPGRRGTSSGGSAGTPGSPSLGGSTPSDRTPVPRQPNVSGALELR